jgi:hypothetical protein
MKIATIKILQKYFLYKKKILILKVLNPNINPKLVLILRITIIIILEVIIIIIIQIEKGQK